MEFRPVRPEELLAVRKLAALAFESPFDDAAWDATTYARRVTGQPADRKERYCDRVWGAFTPEGELAASLRCVPYRVQFDGAEASMSGIGDVCTHPRYRRQGAVRECFAAALRDMYDRGEVFSHLYPFSEKFYRRFGYEAACPTCWWELEIAAIPAFETEGSFELYEGGAVDAFAAVYRRAARWNGMAVREEDDWETVRTARPYRDCRYAYLYRDREGTPQGYWVFQKVREPDGAVMDCRELFFTGPAALWAMMGFIRRFGAGYARVRFAAPAHLPLGPLCEDYARTRGGRKLTERGMTRTVNVRRALELACYRGSGRVSIAVDDPWITENDGVWTASYRHGRAVSVERGPCPAPDGRLSIAAFSAAVMGSLDTQALLYRQDTAVADPAALEALFYGKPHWIADFF